MSFQTGLIYEMRIFPKNGNVAIDQEEGGPTKYIPNTDVRILKINAEVVSIRDNIKQETFRANITDIKNEAGSPITGVPAITTYLTDFVGY